MNKMSSKAYFIIAATFFVIAMMWFFWIKSTAVGIIWSVVAAIELIIALLVKHKEKE